MNLNILSNRESWNPASIRQEEEVLNQANKTGRWMWKLLSKTGRRVVKPGQLDKKIGC